jgi:hypothetical protein
LKLLQNLLLHPNHQYIEVLPTLGASPFEELATRISGYRQVPDATLLHVARYHGLKLPQRCKKIGDHAVV